MIILLSSCSLRHSICDSAVIHVWCIVIQFCHTNLVPHNGRQIYIVACPISHVMVDCEKPRKRLRSSTIYIVQHISELTFGGVWSEKNPWEPDWKFAQDPQSKRKMPLCPWIDQIVYLPIWLIRRWYIYGTSI